MTEMTGEVLEIDKYARFPNIKTVLVIVKVDRKDVPPDWLREFSEMPTSELLNKSPRRVRIIVESGASPAPAPLA